MEPEGSLPQSQVPATCPCPESGSNVSKSLNVEINSYVFEITS